MNTRHSAAEDGAHNRSLSDKDKATLEKREAMNEANKKASLAHQEAEEARRNAEHSKLTPEQKKVRDADQEADDARAQAAQATREAEQHDAVATMADANTMGFGRHPDLSAGHHLAQKFGNDPANPRPKAGLPEVTDNGMVRLQRTTPDKSTPVYTMVHPEMVGDYLRAGWNKSDVEPPTPPVSAASLETAPDGITQVNPETAEERDDEEEVEEEDAETGEKKKVRRKKARRSR